MQNSVVLVRYVAQPGKALGFLPLIGISSLLIGAALLWAMGARSAA